MHSEDIGGRQWDLPTSAYWHMQPDRKAGKRQVDLCIPTCEMESSTEQPASALRPCNAAAFEQVASSTEQFRARTAAWLSTSKASGVTSPTQPCSSTPQRCLVCEVSPRMKIRTVHLVLPAACCLAVTEHMCLMQCTGASTTLPILAQRKPQVSMATSNMWLYGRVARQIHLRYLLIALDSVHKQDSRLLVAGVLHVPQLGCCLEPAASAALRRAHNLPGAEAGCQS